MTPPDLTQKIADMSARLRKRPDDQALRLELIQAYSAAGRVDEFLREAEVYKARDRQVSPPAPVAPPTSSEETVVRGFFDPLPAVEARKRFASGPDAKAPLEALAAEYTKLRMDPAYFPALDRMLSRLAHRPTPLFHAQRLSAQVGGARIYLKHENTGRTDPHLSISVAGQAYLARALGRSKLVAGVRDLHWGVRAASACAHLGLEAEIFVDEELHEAHGSLVFQMQLMGAKVAPTKLASLPHGDIREAGLAKWLASPKDTFLFMGLDSGPDPYPLIARDLTAVIGREMQREIRADAGRGPSLVAVRGGENADAIGVLPAFLDDKSVRLVCVEPEPVPARDHNKVNPFAMPDTGIHAVKAQAILEGLEYESVARERSLLKATGRVEYGVQALNPALDALRNVARLEGLAIGLQTAHTLAWVCEAARKLSPEEVVAVLLAEHPDKDLWDVARLESLGV